MASGDGQSDTSRADASASRSGSGVSAWKNAHHVVDFFEDETTLDPVRRMRPVHDERAQNPASDGVGVEFRSSEQRHEIAGEVFGFGLVGRQLREPGDTRTEGGDRIPGVAR